MSDGREPLNLGESRFEIGPAVASVRAKAEVNDTRSLRVSTLPLPRAPPR